MFKKPFKVKSNTQIKNSERKNLKELLLKTFPALLESDIDLVLPKKEVAFCSKILTATNKHVLVYSIQKRAIFFNVDDVFFPTVYLLWQFPKVGLVFTTNDFVLSKIIQGADLMLPGVINKTTTEHFLAKQVAIVNSNSNIAPVAVGLTAMSSVEMSKATGGKIVVIYHFAGDKLCTLDDMPLLPLPQLGSGMYSYEIDDKEDFPALGSPRTVKDIPMKPIELEDTNQDIKDTNQDTEEDVVPEPVNEVQEMDNLLIECFLTAIKYSKTLEIPILTSSFFKLHVLTNCPDDKVLDIKKSSFKKVGQFLKHMEKEGLIVIKEKKKGVETIEGINKEHPTFIKFYVNIDKRPKKPSDEQDDGQSRNIIESYIVTQAVAPIFKESNINKGDTVQASQIRQYVTNYVRKHNCQDEENKRFVKLQDPHLTNLCKNEVAVTWEDLIEKVIGSMKSCFKITTATQETTSKGKIQPIILSVQTRSGNKKVTIVDNLELYSIKMSEFAKECQHGVAASTSISRPPGKKVDQILIQGNQVLFVYNLLTDKYKIPKKYIRGLENAPKTKK